MQLFAGLLSLSEGKKGSTDPNHDSNLYQGNIDPDLAEKTFTLIITFLGPIYFTAFYHCQKVKTNKIALTMTK